MNPDNWNLITIKVLHLKKITSKKIDGGNVESSDLVWPHLDIRMNLRYSASWAIYFDRLLTWSLYVYECVIGFWQICISQIWLFMSGDWPLMSPFKCLYRFCRTWCPFKRLKLLSNHWQSIGNDDDIMKPLNLLLHGSTVQFCWHWGSHTHCKHKVCWYI